MEILIGEVLKRLLKILHTHINSELDGGWDTEEEYKKFVNGLLSEIEELEGMLE